MGGMTFKSSSMCVQCFFGGGGGGCVAYATASCLHSVSRKSLRLNGFCNFFFKLLSTTLSRGDEAETSI